MNLFTPLSWSDSGFILTGILNTVYISVVAIVIGSLLGLLVGFVRAESNKTINVILGSFLDVLRSVPLIIQLILFSTFVGAMGYPLEPFAAGSIILSLYTMAFMSEVFRSGFDSVPESMVKAARSLGMSYFQTVRYIRIPIGMRAVFPSW